MVDDQDLDDSLARHRNIRQSLPNAWGAFFARFGRLREVQLAAIPRILGGENLLVTAATASGKTEAVIAPVCERMIAHQWKGLSVLLVTPTRALVNDLHDRLSVPCDQMGILVGRKTSDHPLSGRLREQLLITTPESTESLLTFRRETLTNLRAIVLDEIHLLNGSPRGDQLRLILARLQAYLRHVRGLSHPGFQMLALSATVPQPDRVARAYLGLTAVVLPIPGRRDLQANILLAEGDDRARAQVAVEATSAFHAVSKVLVFVNSRKQVDAGASEFRWGRFASVPVYGHHGNLSKEEREDVEARFRNDTRAVCVATMTLEVGIDIGDIDLVICMDPPFSLSSFLQRMG